jgi:hypothetical protein
MTGAYKSYPGNAVLADNPTGYWRLNETSGGITYDHSGSGSHLVYSGAATLGQSGYLSGDTSTSVLFKNGTSTGVAGSSTGGSSKIDNFSMEAWVYPTAATQNAYIFATSSYTFGMTDGVGGVGSKLTVQLGGVSWDALSSTYSLSINQWQHIVITRANGVWSSYVNGVRRNTGSTANPNVPVGTPGVAIGGPAPWDPNFQIFSGKIADAAFYEYPLSLTQIQTHYNSGNGPGWWFCRSQTPLSSNWNLLTTLYDGTTAKLFLNGQQECSVTPGTTYSGAIASTKIGATPAGTSFWTGLLASLNVFGTSDGTAPATATTIKNDFDVSANRYRKVAIENIATSGLVVNLDAANAKQGLAHYSEGCAGAELSWFDLSSNAYNGTLKNYASCGASSGWMGSGTVSNPYVLMFDGTNDYVESETSLAFTTSNTSFTVLGWFKTSSTAQGVLISKGAADSTGGFAVMINDTAAVGKLKVFIKDSGNLAPGIYSTSNTLNNDAWHHFAGVVTTNTATAAGNNISLYIDSASDAATYGPVTNPYGGNSANYPIRLGQRMGTNFYTGSIANMQIYNRALSAQEIKQNCLAQEGRFTATAQSICGAP